jgi:hypothetical protein
MDKSQIKSLPCPGSNSDEERYRTVDLGGLISIAAWLNFLLSFIYWLKIDFLNYWISRPLYWWEKRESAYTLSCFIFCAACIHTFMFARAYQNKRRALRRRENRFAKTSTAALLDKTGDGEMEQEGDGVGLPEFGFGQRNARSKWREFERNYR